MKNNFLVCVMLVLISSCALSDVEKKSYKSSSDAVSNQKMDACQKTRVEKQDRWNFSNSYFYLSRQELADLIDKANEGDWVASEKISLHYFMIELDEKRAIKWAEKALKDGSPNAREYLDSFK
jgi:TPR repeat protein